MGEVAARVETEPYQLVLIRRLNSILESYLKPEQIREVSRAIEFATRAHAGQFRVSGESYICHPVSVAIILADMRMDYKGIMAAILHDVIEDTTISKQNVGDEFGAEVAELVDGVSKLTQLDSKSQLEAQAQNVRKMFLASARDLRVIMVKLADRVHNMRTLGVMPPEKRRRIARETLEIYAPIANRLGMNQIRLELEDRGFSSLYPMRHAVLKRGVQKARGHRKEVLATVETDIKNRLSESGLNCEVIGREKHLRSIYEKMLTKRISFREVFDVYAFRIVVSEVDECYRVLGVVHNLYSPLPGRFKDYIALPKANGYQALHSVLVGPFGIPVEIQVRTQKMHRIAESGIAAHWLYKIDSEHEDNSQARAHEWLRDLLEIQKSAGNSLEFIENLKVDLFAREIYVFTPKGRIVKLPRGATVVDFAYAVHTDIGNSCVSARVDKRLAPLQCKLVNGQTVEVITANWARPNPLWLNYVATAKARAAIRSFLRHFKRQEAICLGRRLLDKELDGHDTCVEGIPPDQLSELIRDMEYESVDDLFEDIGLGNRMPFLVAKRLCQSELSGIKLEDQQKVSDAPLVIKGTEGMVVNLAKCCRPIPGDPIIGYFNPGKGIVVHQGDCKNLFDTGKSQTNWLDVEWDQNVSGEYPVEIRLDILNRRGTLATVASVISRTASNIENISIRGRDHDTSTDFITVTVKDRVHLARILRELKRLPIVLRLSRVSS